MLAVTIQTQTKSFGEMLLQYLLPVSLLYLALPAVIFFAAWLSPLFALGCTVLLLLPLLYHLPRSGWGAGHTTPPALKLGHLVGAALLALLIVSISGIGGYGYQDSDWLKHNAILKDLVERPWPVIYEIEGIPLPLVYYIAYYLPAALAGKVFGSVWANHILLIWSWFGLTLSILWFIILARHNPFLGLLIFTIFSGLDALGMVIHLFILGPMTKWNHFEWWAENWQYSANITLIFFVPHQALSAWIVTGILLYTFLYRRRKSELLYYLSLTPLWSPLITLGLLPYLAVDFLRGLFSPASEEEWKAPAYKHSWLGTLGLRLKAYLSLTNLCGLALMAVYLLFYSTKFYEIPLSLEESIYGFIFNVPETENATWPLILHLLIWFVLLEFGVYLLVMKFSPANANWVLITTIVLLTLLPLFKYGRNNDLVMRASIPALFIFAIYVAQAASRQAGWRRVILGVLLILGAITPLVEVTRHLKVAYEEKALFQIPDLETVDDLFVIQKKRYRGESFLVQYLGSADTPFFNLMARSTHCQLPPEIPLQVAEPEPFFYPLSDRFTLTCVDKQLTDDRLIVNLMLHTRPPADNQETHDTIYVHLVNEQGERVAGSDILLYKDYKAKTISTHDIMLPPDLAAGTYHLVIGTYYFNKDILVNVGSVNLETAIVVN